MKSTAPTKRKSKPRGFACMKLSDIKRIASKGGKSMAKKRGRRWLQKIGRLGGTAKKHYKVKATNGKNGTLKGAHA